MKIQQSYARVLEGENSTRFEIIDGVASVEDQVIKQLKDNKIDIHPDEIAACHTSGKPAEDRTQQVIVRFVSKKSKVRTLMNARNSKEQKSSSTNTQPGLQETSENGQGSEDRREDQEHVDTGLQRLCEDARGKNVTGEKQGRSRPILVNY